MAKTYISRVSKDEKHIVHYSFVCEHCNANSGPLMAEVTASAYREGGNIKFTPSGQVAQETHNEVLAEAKAELAKQMLNAYNLTQKGQYGRFSSKCPHCKKPQSWSLKGTAGGNLLSALVLGVLAALVLMALRFFFHLPISNLVHALISAGVAVVTLIITTIQYANTKTQVKHVAQRQTPVIEWHWNFGTMPNA